MSSFAEQSTRSWTSDLGLRKCHHQPVSMVPLCILNHADSTENTLPLHCCLVTVGWTRVLFLGRCLLLSLSSAACAMMKLFCTSIDDLYDHSVAVHLPKPSPVSLPIASMAKSFSVSLDASSARGTTPALEDALMVDDAKKRRLTWRKSGEWRTWFSNAKQDDRSTSARRRGLPRGLEEKPAAFGHHHQTVSEDRTRHEVTVRSHLRHSHHGNGARRGEEHERTDASGTTRESRQRATHWDWLGVRNPVVSALQ